MRVEAWVQAERRHAPTLAYGGAQGCRLVEMLVSAAFCVPLGEMRTARRGTAAAAFARQAAMYLAHVDLGLSLSDVGKAFGRDRTTVAHACATVEDRREDFRLARILDCLEAAIDRWQRGIVDGPDA